MRDCAAVACPTHYSDAPPGIETGLSSMVPLAPDTRYRLHGPRDMLELTRLLYGDIARVGEPYRNFTNPYHRQPHLRYDWTQIHDKKLEAAWDLLPNRGRSTKLVVEVGSFLGRSSVLIANWLKRREERLGHAAPPLLCIDTWSGDVGMTLNQIYPVEMGKRNGHATLYQVWLLNVMHANLTDRVLPLVAPSLMGARVLAFLRMAIDVLYLDSAHEFRETFFELTAYWPLLRPGGLLIGDDFNWRAVSHDVQLFARVYEVQLSSFNGCHTRLIARTKSELCVWYLQKPLIERFKGIVERRPAMRYWRSDHWSSDHRVGGDRPPAHALGKR